MTLRVYNTLSKQKELFETTKPGEVGIYLCGPTVYKPPHIGHMVGPIIFDAIKRYLAYKGFKVTWVVNITDVDDKLIKEAVEQKSTMAEVAERCTAQYLDALNALGIDGIDVFPKASEHIPEIIAMCQTLVEKGHAYPAGGNLWFDVSSDPDYGKLSHRSADEQESGTRDLEGLGKRDKADFALWKAAKKGEPTWDSPWGPGRPGWHIECSAMSMRYLGKTFDIHGGGMDLLFPHHENELAQSESATAAPFARFWMHNNLTKMKTKLASGEVKSEKMSKSLGNVVGAREAIDDLGPDLLRYLVLSTHYRSPIDFSEEVVVANRKALGTLQRLFERVERLTGKSVREKQPDLDSAANDLLDGGYSDFAREGLALKMKFLEMMDDDFNTAGAIAVLHELTSLINGFIERGGLEKSKPAPASPSTAASAASAATQTLRNLGLILGLFRVARAAPGGRAGKSDDLPDKLMSLIIRLRADARAAKNFPLSDAIRKGLADIGITVEDRPDGTIWRRN
jgi:cysteinyl-tRNA synthetase